MKILAIETSCDETSASVVTSGKSIIVNSLSTSSSVDLHAATGGVIPEQAAREQLKYIIPVIVEALWNSNNNQQNASYEEKFKASQKILNESIDAIAVTVGPGLIGSLLVGVETAKTLAYIFEKPIIPVNHLLGHLYANFIDSQNLNAKRLTLDASPSFPFIGLIASGGHTDLLFFESHKKFKWLGGTRDDAAGEALDKVGRLLDLSYPAGPEIEKRASNVKDPKIVFKSPMIHDKTYEFSFSGLKTEAAREIKRLNVIPAKAGIQKFEGNTWIPDQVRNDNNPTINEICYALQKAVIDVLVKKTLKAAVEYNAKSILVGGGVAANQTLINQLRLNAKRLTLDANIFSPEKKYCTDNAAMIGTFAIFHNNPVDWKNVQANPELYFT